ncbi:hypothetical protein [Mycolicibacterium agri]|uniref:hypothetical protein n=1 Tax=Mycolicibacterium agri TaxID=36811 RepID=UPI003FCEBC02
MIAGCEAAWEFFGGVFAVLIPDNLKPVIADADAVNPQFTHGWLDYAGHAGFLTDPARVASPKDKPRVERAVQYVRRNFWDGETFTSIEAAQRPLRPGVVTPRAPYARHHVCASGRAVHRRGAADAAAGAGGL